MTTSDRMLPDAQWLTLLRSGKDSEFSTIDRRHAVHGLVAATVVLATADAGTGVLPGYAERWLHELGKAVVEDRFVPGPVCNEITLHCLALLPVVTDEPLPPRPVLSAAELAVPLTDAEWLGLLHRDETRDKPGLLVAYSCLLTAGPVVGASEVGRLWFAVANVLLYDPQWRPGPLVSRILAQMPAEAGKPAAKAFGRDPLADLQGLAGIVESDDPTGPWIF